MNRIMRTHVLYPGAPALLFGILSILIMGGFDPAYASRVLVDPIGRRITLPDTPRRVVALAPSITEIIFSLDRDDRLIGVTRYSDYPPAAATLPRVGSYVYLDLERIVALKPDLCIAVKDGNPKAVISRLSAMGIPVYAVDPRNLDALMDTIGHIGIVLNAVQNARNLVDNMRMRIKAVTRRVGTIAQRPGVFFQIGISPIVSVGSGTVIHELVILAGGNNLTRGPVPYPRIARERIIALAPDVVVITSMAGQSGVDRVLEDWRKWADIPAVKHHRIHVVDSNLFDRPTPRIIDGLEYLCGILHPEKTGSTP